MTKKRYFGTDGIRGRVGAPPITPEFILKLGWAVGRVLASRGDGWVLIGKDTRISGYLFESALECGLSSAGVGTNLVGPMPTPGVAYLARTLHANAGIVISASHNPYYDNGIKFFSGKGTKLPDEIELAIEEMIEQPLKMVSPAKIGKAKRVTDAVGRYIEFCKSTFPHELDLSDRTIVVDCANGADYHIAPHVFEELGAKTLALHVQPDGLNINEECGSTHPRILQERVVAKGADLGIALDGDGDRLIMVDDQGDLVDGDALLFIIAQARKRENRLQGSVVGTVMSNLGLENSLADFGIGFHRTAVGDRHILEKLLTEQWNLGGESSGHIICRDCTTTGDGIISALQVLAEMQRQHCSLRELASGMQRYPQTLINVPAYPKCDLNAYPAIVKAVHEVTSTLGKEGRVLLRASGTEPVARVMVEGRDATAVQQYAEQLAEVVREAVSDQISF